MNLLIVEDEVRLRNALANNIPWDKHGIEVVGQAGNGVEALRIIDLKKPEIILLDLQMPEMDGLSLARQLRESDPLLKIIVLSGHDDFAFAQEALDLGVMKYLLKPAGDAEILETVLEAAERLKSELEQRHNEVELKLKWKLHLPYLVNEFFQGWLHGKFERWELDQKSKDLHLDLPSDGVFAVTVVDMDPLSEDETRFSRNDMSLLRFSLEKIVKEALESTLQATSCWVSTNLDGCTVIIYQLAGDDAPQVALQKINAMTEKLLFTVKSCLKLSASAGISGMTGGITDMNKLYVQALRALQNRIVLGHDLAIPYRVEQGREPALSFQPNLEKALEIALETGESDKAIETLTAIWTGGMAKAETIDDMREHILYFTSLWISLIQKQGWPVREVAGEDYVYFYNQMELTSKEQILSWLHRMIRAYFTYAGHRRKSTSHAMIKTILNLVENEIDQEMTLQAVADRLYVNSSYLSRLFKQETSKAFSTYVLERKMEKAKLILQEGSRVYDAASCVGYRDVSYFTRVFRKYWGITPGEVRS